MEDITLERLYENFDAVIKQIDDIIKRNDIEAARNVLEQIKELVTNKEHVALDDNEPERGDTGIPYDHVIHRLLDNITGVIRTASRIEVDEELRGYIDRRRQIDIDIKDIDTQLEALGPDGYTRTRTIEITEINENIRRIHELIERRRRSLNRKGLTPAGRQRIEAEINELLVYQHDLELFVSGREGVDVSFLDKTILKYEREERKLQRKIDAIENQPTQESQLSQEIARLEAEEDRLSAEYDRLNAEYIAAQERGEDGQEIIDQIHAVSDQILPISKRKNILIEIRDTKSALLINERYEQQALEEIEKQSSRTILGGNRDLEIAQEELERIRAELNQNRATLEGTENRERIGSLETTIASYDADIEELEGRFPSLDEEDHRRLETLNRERNELQQELEDRRLRQQLLEEYGQDRTPDFSERDALTQRLEQVREELTLLRERRTRLQEGPTEEITLSEHEMLIRMLEIRINVLNKQRDLARRGRRTAEVAQIDQEIEEITRRITVIRDTEQVIGTDNSARRAELEQQRQALITEREELDVLINRKRTELRVPGERLDVGEAVREIGDHIFKAADIRQQLLDRNYTREDFLRFYRQGKENAINEMSRMAPEIDAAKAQVALMTVDRDSDTNLYEQYKNATEEAEKRRILEKIRQNLLTDPELAEKLRNAGFDEDLTTVSPEKLAEYEQFFTDVRQATVDGLTGLQAEFEEHKENVAVFDREIAILEKELRTVEEIRDFSQNGARDANDEIDLRERQARATALGDEKIEKEWNERIDNFVSHKATKEITVDGHTYTIDTIEDYPEYKEDAYFLNLENYKKYLENTSLYDRALEDLQDEGKALKLVASTFDLTSVEFDEYNQLLADGKQDEAQEWMKKYLSEQKDYVRSYHGFTNQHAVRYATLRTAGSTLQAMVPVRGDLPTTTKMKNALTNVARFLMLRKPEFTRTNAKGEKVPNVLGGLTTLGLDALVVGGAAIGTIVGGPAALIPYGVFYASKGIVTAGNVIAARREYKKNSEEIDSNIPYMKPLTKRDHEVMRRDYYREVEHYSRPRAWIRGKLDKYFTKNRGEETDKAVAARTAERAKASIVASAVAKEKVLIENAKRAKENQRVRVQRTHDELASARTYNQIVADPEKVDQEQATSIAAQNAAVRSVRPGAPLRSVNPESGVEIDDKYTKDEVAYGQTGDLRSTEVPKGTASVNAITVDQKYRSAMERQDAINRVLTMILTTAGNLGISWARGKLKEIQYRKEKEDDQVIPQPDKKEAVYRTENRTVDDYETVTRTEGDTSTRLRDLQVTEENYNNTYGAPNGNPSSIGGNGRVDGVAIRIRDANGNGVEWSAGEPGSGIIAGRHVHGTFSGDISDGSVLDMCKALRDADPSGYQAYCRATGLDPNNIEAVAQHALENNQIWVQSSNLEGWSQHIGGGLREVSEQVLVGSHLEPYQVFDHWNFIPQDPIVIPGEWIDVPYEVITLKQIVGRTLDGAIIGAAGTGVDALHEVARPTDKALRGNHEEINPDLLYSKLALEAQEEYDKKVRDEKKKTEDEKKPEEKKDEPAKKPTEDNER